MMRSRYHFELQKLPATYEVAIQSDIQALKSAISGASQSSIVACGSGGSFTVASLLCGLHEQYTGRISRPSTPLEIICNPNLAMASPVFLISAEGRNPDIIEALHRARRHSSRPLHVITNHTSSPLIDSISQLTDVAVHAFTLSEKDGYLATNSLLLDAVLIARAYEELDNASTRIPSQIGELQLNGITLDAWMEGATDFAAQAASRGNIIILFSPLLRSVAADLESKLSESALLYCQLADLRSFAHGRHLWLAQRKSECCILAFVDPPLRKLWDEMAALLPPDVPTMTMAFGGHAPRDLLAGLVAQMRFVSALADQLQQDPGNPSVPQFGRDLHYIKVADLIPAPTETTDHGEDAKYKVLGAHWPNIDHRGPMQRARESVADSLSNQTFRAIVFDYDGVLCSSQRNDATISEPIRQQLLRLIEGEVLIGVASGRGGSVQETIRQSFSESLWAKIQLGLYNSGWISDAADTLKVEQENSEFLSHVTRIVNRLKSLGVPIETIRPTHPYQVSVRFHEGIHGEDNWFVIADALREAGLDLSRLVHSKHSVDILAPGVNKTHLVAHMVKHFKIDPYQVLTVGDQGAWPGNDSSLLEHRYSLSVEAPSRRLDRGWKLAPAHKRDVDATLWYLQRIQLQSGGTFVLKLSDTRE
jgi:HAD superfamily hydrolase (TIGR01484 family)